MVETSARSTTNVVPIERFGSIEAPAGEKLPPHVKAKLNMLTSPVLKKLEIPEQDAAVLKQWLVNDDEPIEAVLRALESAEPALRWQTLATRVADASGLPREKVEPLVQVLLNAVNTIAHFDEEDRREASAIFFHSVLGDVADAEERERFQRHFARVSQAKSIEITGKALGVQQEDQHEFCIARLVSQVRPVFSDETLEPKASVIIHQLKIVYHVGPEGDRDEIFIAMTREDLSFLRGVIDRALLKHDKLVAHGRKGRRARAIVGDPWALLKAD